MPRQLVIGFHPTLPLINSTHFTLINLIQINTIISINQRIILSLLSFWFSYWAGPRKKSKESNGVG
jgi:hypothetical protein